MVLYKSFAHGRKATATTLVYVSSWGFQSRLPHPCCDAGGSFFQLASDISPVDFFSAELPTLDLCWPGKC